MAVETRSPKGAATRDQILDAASRLILLRGYHCTSLDDVLKESGVGKGNFYYYFKSKEDLGYAIIARVVKAFVEHVLEPAFADAQDHAVDQIDRFLDLVVEDHRQRKGVGGCPMGNLASELSDVHEGFRQRFAGIFGLWEERMARALERGQATGDLRQDFDPAAAAQFVAAALEGAILMTKVTRDMSVLDNCAAELRRHLTLYRVSGTAAAGPSGGRWPARPGAEA
jgi:TetR/AcrR family transcriptional repressor of nem operon